MTYHAYIDPDGRTHTLQADPMEVTYNFYFGENIDNLLPPNCVSLCCSGKTHEEAIEKAKALPRDFIMMMYSESVRKHARNN